MARINFAIFALIVFATSMVSFAHATKSYDFSCETTVTVVEQFDGEIKYNCIVKNTGDSFLQLYYEVQPEQNPIDPHVAVGFHPQPSNIYLEAGESQPIAGFEVLPRVPTEKSEIRFTRTFTVHPTMESEDQVKSTPINITTIVKSEPLREETRIYGKVIDAQTGKPIVNATIFLKYKRFEARSRTAPNGEYSANLQALQYLMMVEANGYELFAQEISPKKDGELKIDVRLERAKEKGTYELARELKLESGAWEGVWRSAISGNGQFVVLGMGGQRVKTDSLESYFYLFHVSGEQILKMNTVDEVRGIDVSAEGSLVAVSLGNGQFGNGADEEYEKVLLYKKNGELVWKKLVKNSAFQEIRFSHDGKYIAVGDTEGYIYLLDAADGKEIWKKFTRGQVRAIRFYDDNSHILVGSGDDHVYLFDINGNQKWKTYVHSWSYGFIAATPGNEFSAAGGHVGYLHLLDKDGKDIWAYETDGGFRWAELGPDASFAVGGTRSELAFLDSKGKVLWKGRDSVSGTMTKDKKYILTGDQRGGLELRDTRGTVLWKHETGLLEPGKDVRLSYVSDDATIIVGATKTGEVYFFKGGISNASLEAENRGEEDTISGEQPGPQHPLDVYNEEQPPSPPEPQRPPPVNEQLQMQEKGLLEKIIDFFASLFK